ncbi:rhomboid family intramembrane serine protease [Oceanicoccus sp. KOV_DT_Chl]|uniref:rhomboid family intramembrane serine protease n=1 Tax=Oceanicoccus sp. KOV_DT_Chl TaxID=1904639 RepID=UPI000C79BE3C|nr:rhomboid family intramembrane serine protease [Oceanicoccus sp. KOV_DT_Chl]
MGEIVVVNVGLDEDLQAFSQYLWQQGVAHRVIESEGRRLLLVGDKTVAAQVHDIYQQWQDGVEELPAINLPPKPEAAVIASKLFQHLPVTIVFIALSIVGFLIVSFDRDYDLVKYFTFFDFDRVRQYVVFSIPEGQYWRLITPIFLHFGLMHIAFNMCLLWFVGQRIELLQGSVRMLGITMVIGLGSNILQAKYAEVSIFGGMSGVVYGLLGYGWIWSLLRPAKNLQIPNVILYFSLGMMVLGFAGFAGMLGAGKIANVAHLGGLIMGCLMGLGAALIDKFSADQQIQN